MVPLVTKTRNREERKLCYDCEILRMDTKEKLKWPCIHSLARLSYDYEGK